MKSHIILRVTILFLLIFSINTYSAQASETYYVKPASEGGNDSADGLSDATAWATITKINKTVSQIGADVYLKCGGTWVGKGMWIDWSGTNEDRVVIGAYYMENGLEKVGVKGNKPVINGNHTVPGEYIGLVQVNSQDYVTVENLKFINSEGQFIRFYKGADNGIARNIDGIDSYNAGIQWYVSKNGLAENCKVTLAGMGYHDGLESDWPYGIGATAECDNITVRGCTVYNIYGEGIGFYRGSDNCIAENNLVYGAQKIGIYIGAGQHCIVRYNIVYGTTNNDFHRADGAVGPGLAVADEGWIESRTKYNYFYGNLVAFCKTGMHIGCSLEGAIFADSYIYNNTFVGCNIMVVISGSNFSNSSIKNNIFWLAGGNKLYDGPSKTSGLVWDHNNWSATISGDQSGSNDVIGEPLLKKTTGWRSLTDGTLSLQDFALQNNSPNINKGVNLGDSYKNLLDATYSNIPSNVVTKDQDQSGSGWDIGGIIFIEDNGVVEILPPSNVKVIEGS